MRSKKLSATIESPMSLSEGNRPATLEWCESIGGARGSTLFYKFADFNLAEDNEHALWLRFIPRGMYFEASLMQGRKVMGGAIPIGAGLTLAGRRIQTRHDVVQILKVLGAEFNR